MIDYKVVPLGEILSKEYSQQLIEDAFKKFSCQRETDLENFLVKKSILYERANYGKTYLIIDDKKLQEGEFIVVAYFTIAQTSICISDLSKKRKRKALGEYPGRDNVNSVPAYLIGQIGRSDNYTNVDLSGQELLNECYHSISMASMIVGGNLVVLECRECMLGKFYESQGFRKLYDELNGDKLYTLYKKISFGEYWVHTKLEISMPMTT